MCINGALQTIYVEVMLVTSQIQFGTFPIMTSVLPGIVSKFWPEIVSKVPPPIDPTFGDNPVTSVYNVKSSAVSVAG